MSLDLKPDRVDTLADLPSATADAIRAELREGERVAYATVPVTALDAGTWAAWA